MSVAAMKSERSTRIGFRRGTGGYAFVVPHRHGQRSRARETPGPRPERQRAGRCLPRFPFIQIGLPMNTAVPPAVTTASSSTVVRIRPSLAVLCREVETPPPPAAIRILATKDHGEVTVFDSSV